MDANAKNMKTLELADQVRRFEIDLFWRRSVFFWGFTAIALGGYAAAIKAERPGLQFGAGCFGLICGVAWTLVNRGSKYWQENWETKVHQAAQNAALPVELFPEREQPLPRGESWGWRAKHFSVSGVAIAFSDFTILVWTGLILAGTSLPNVLSRCIKEAVILIVTAAAAAAILIFSSRSGRLNELRRWLLGDRSPPQ